MALLLPGLALTSLGLPFLLPTDIVFLLPLVSWTFALQWFIDEQQFHSAWTRLPPNSSANHDTHMLRSRTLAEWFDQWVWQGGLCPAVSNPLCWSSSAVSIYQLRHRPWSIKGWYCIGLLLASVIHLRFGNDQYESYMRIAKSGEDGSSIDRLKAWLKMHTLRLFVVDVPAWVCFFIAIVQVLRS